MEMSGANFMPGRFNPRARAPDMYWTESRVSPKAGLDVLENWESNPVSYVQPVA